ncbi:uncharacterized protein PgNI_02546 [Pyricularia grisea]|uniref:Carrier domain-containing protein n=1 Tax=Pyricularia grisea TaxID=148305 RepID=A0A6P8BIU2_PYRGI|nr:uncharacterized protein PgNI_02546 [Pyricularia grisea]TLD16698.1 hypothetical protein PgNI_02546 [Pyricularia grisea]
MAIFHSLDNSSGSKTGSSSAPDSVRAFLTSAEHDPTILQTPEAVRTLAVEIANRLCSLLLLDEKQVAVTTNTADLGLDSLVAVELRACWQLNLGVDVSTLELLSSGTCEALGQRAVNGLVKLRGLYR